MNRDLVIKAAEAYANSVAERDLLMVNQRNLKSEIQTNQDRLDEVAYKLEKAKQALAQAALQ